MNPWTRGAISLYAGDTEAAIPAIEKAMRLRPLDPQWGGTVNVLMAAALSFGGRPEDALPWIRKALQEKLIWMAAHRNLVGTLWLSGRHDEAKDAARKFIELFPGFSVR